MCLDELNQNYHNSQPFTTDFYFWKSTSANCSVVSGWGRGSGRREGGSSIFSASCPHLVIKNRPQKLDTKFKRISIDILFSSQIWHNMTPRPPLWVAPKPVTSTRSITNPPNMLYLNWYLNKNPCPTCMNLKIPKSHFVRHFVDIHVVILLCHLVSDAVTCLLSFFRSDGLSVLIFTRISCYNFVPCKVATSEKQRNLNMLARLPWFIVFMVI